MQVGTNCDGCKYRHKELKDGWNVVCDAYPNGIPCAVIASFDKELVKDCGGGYKYEKEKNG